MMRTSVLFFILLCIAPVFAQYESEEYTYYEENDDDELRIDKKYEVIYGSAGYNEIDIDDDYKSKYKGEDFTYIKELPEEKKKEEPVDNSYEAPREVSFTGWPKFFMNLLLVLAVALLAFIIFKLVQNFNYKPGNKKLENTEYEADEEEIIEEKIDKTSLTYLIAQAKKNENYALAIRYYFLLYLNKLQDLKLVEFHIDKTNADYLMEIKDDEKIVEFTQVSYLFEYVWYGKKALNKDSFEYLEQQFTQKINVS